MAVIKANAYGHGLVWAAQALREADAFGVASIDEGLELRASGIAQPISLLEGFFDAAEIPLLQLQRLSPVIHHETQLQALEQTPGARDLSVWLKIDTGMHRLGFAPDLAASALTRLQACATVASTRVMTHFANADNTFDNATHAQIELFNRVVGSLQLQRSLANSAGLVAWPRSRLEWVRPGIMLYGASPVIGRSAHELGLKPVMTLQSALIAVHRLRKGDTVGYGGDWVCPHDMPIGVVAIGYGDGYPRQMRTGAPVLVNGRRVPLIGRVSMDMIAVDLSTQPQARVGDAVVLWGAGLPAEELAPYADTVAYTLFCGVTPRIPRVSIDSATTRHGQAEIRV